MISYHVSDNNSGGVIYYRLKQVDFNGLVSYFNVIATNCVEKTNSQLTGYFYNNELIIDYLSKNPQELDITLYSSNGKLVFSHRFMPFVGKNKLQMSESVAKGIYLLKITQKGNVTNLKLLK